ARRRPDGRPPAQAPLGRLPAGRPPLRPARCRTPRRQRL
ncbi:MAG: hypothetical protein AVDCRST_MAG07-2634, partial [uncultured Frankineae bacterium]